MEILEFIQRWGVSAYHSRLFRETLILVIIAAVIATYYQHFVRAAELHSRKLRERRQHTVIVRTRLALIALFLGFIGVIVYDRVLPAWGVGAQEAVGEHCVARQASAKPKHNKKMAKATHSSKKKAVVSKPSFDEPTTIQGMGSDRAVEIVKGYYENHPNEMKETVDDYRFITTGRDETGAAVFIVAAYKTDDDQYTELHRFNVHLDGLFDQIK